MEERSDISLGEEEISSIVVGTGKNKVEETSVKGGERCRCFQLVDNLLYL